MEHVNIENKIQAIRNALEVELKQTKVVDSEGKATNLKAFEKIVDAKIKELEDISKSITDEAGIAPKGYSMGILLENTRALKEIRKTHSISRTNEALLKKQIDEEERLNKKSGLSRAKIGIKGLLTKLSNQRQNKEKSR